MFDNRLEILRKEKKLTQQEVAMNLQIPTNTYRNYEKDEREPPSDVLINIANMYDVSIDWLLGVSEYRNTAEEMTLSKMKEFQDKDSNSVDIYRLFVKCTEEYKTFYAEYFGPTRLKNGEFQPTMSIIMYNQVKEVISSYDELYKFISTCTTVEKLKECVLMINKCLDNISEARNSIIEEAFRIYNKRTGTTSVTKTYDVTAYTQNIAAGTGSEGFTAEKIEEVESFARQIAEIEGNGTV